MPFQVPEAVNYPSPLNAVPTRWGNDPNEGPKIINCEVDWGTMGGTSKTVAFNLQNNATLNFSQIVALAVDNSGCGSDLQFSFPDTETTISIPAYAPYTVIPVFTNQTQFYLQSPNSESEDVTRFAILNSLPPPIAVPTTQEQSVASSDAFDATTSGTRQLVATGISGTLEAMDIEGFIGSTGSNAATTTIQLKDGLGNVVHSFTGGTYSNSLNGSFSNISVARLTDLRVRFQSGLVLSWTNVTTNTMFLASNLYYRTP